LVVTLDIDETKQEFLADVSEVLMENKGKNFRRVRGASQEKRTLYMSISDPRAGFADCRRTIDIAMSGFKNLFLQKRMPNESSMRSQDWEPLVRPVS